MTPIKQGKYEFKKDSLKEVRNRIGISQIQLAKRLGIPANTLSRWETGATIPDATHLAAFYSLVKEYNVTPAFFGLRDNLFPYDLIVIWDFQTVGTSTISVQYAHSTVMQELKRRFSGRTPLLKAFAHPTQNETAKELQNLGWRISIDDSEVFQYIIDDARSDCGHNPEGTIFVLISDDYGFSELITELKSSGVCVYVMSTQTFNNKLFDKVDQGFGIQLYPMGLEPPKRQINKPSDRGFTFPSIDHLLNGGRIT